MGKKKIIFAALSLALLGLLGVGAFVIVVEKIDEKVKNFVMAMDKDAVIEREAIRLSKTHGFYIMYEVESVKLEF